MINNLIKRYPALIGCKDSITLALELMKSSVLSGGMILLCGNGGSCADCDHICGELMKGFLSKRPLSGAEKNCFTTAFPNDSEYLVSHLQRGIPAISLPSQTAVISAFSNDVKPDLIYAQLIFGLGRKNDLAVGISTSGNSKNVVYAMKTAKARGLSTLALTGESGGDLKNICDVTISVPETETYKVQEYHLPVYHYLCAALEESLFTR